MKALLLFLGTVLAVNAQNSWLKLPTFNPDGPIDGYVPLDDGPIVSKRQMQLDPETEAKLEKLRENFVLKQGYQPYPSALGPMVSKRQMQLDPETEAKLEKLRENFVLKQGYQPYPSALGPMVSKRQMQLDPETEAKLEKLRENFELKQGYQPYPSALGPMVSKRQAQMVDADLAQFLQALIKAPNSEKVKDYMVGLDPQSFGIVSKRDNSHNGGR